MKIAIHQPNFLPWFPYFEKMNQADVFVLLTECQYTKNSWTNRCQVNGKWWTNPVDGGMRPIIDKTYTTGQSLFNVNVQLIHGIAAILDIDATKIKFDFPTDKKATERIIEICKFFHCDEYLANVEAEYLDKELLELNDIKLVPFVSKNKKHVFELFNEIGIEKTRELLNERESSKETKKDLAYSSKA